MQLGHMAQLEPSARLPANKAGSGFHACYSSIGLFQSCMALTYTVYEREIIGYLHPNNADQPLLDSRGLLIPEK